MHGLVQCTCRQTDIYIYIYIYIYIQISWNLEWNAIIGLATLTPLGNQYTSATELHPKCGVTLHMPQHRKVTPRQVAMLLKFIIKTLSHSDWYKRLHPSTHRTSCGPEPAIQLPHNSPHSSPTQLGIND